MPKASFLLHHEQAEIFRAMSPEQAGKLLLYLFDYSENGTPLPESERDQAIKFSFLAIKIRIDADAEHYRSVCEKRSASGSLGGRGKTKAIAFSESKKSKSKQKKLSDSDSDSDTEENKKDISPLYPPTGDRHKIPPLPEWVAAYCAERKNGIDPQAFFDHYASANWFRGKTKIKDWQRCVHTWEASRKSENLPAVPGARGQPPGTYAGMRVNTVAQGELVMRDQMAKALKAQREKEAAENGDRPDDERGSFSADGTLPALPGGQAHA